MDADLRRELTSEVDDVFACAVRVLPISHGQPDTARDPIEINAVLRTGDRDAVAMHGGKSQQSRANIAATGGFLRIDREEYPDLVVRQHDKIVAIERHGLPVFEILHVDDRSHLRLICKLGDVS